MLYVVVRITITADKPVFNRIGIIGADLDSPFVQKPALFILTTGNALLAHDNLT